MLFVRSRRWLLATAMFPLVLAACTGTADRPGSGTGAAGRDAGSGSAAPGGRQGSSAVRHVWVIELENQGYAQSSADPYLARTLPRLLRTIEDSFGLPHLGDAAMPRSGPSAPTCPASRHRLNPAPGQVRRQQPRQRPGNASAVRRRSGATVPDRQCLADRRQLRRVHLLRAAEPQFRGVPRLVLPVHCRQRCRGCSWSGSRPGSSSGSGSCTSIEATFGLFNAKANGGAVAFFAHVGGFIFGLLVARLFAARAGQAAPEERWPWTT